jgi:hypothetical protein
MSQARTRLFPERAGNDIRFPGWIVHVFIVMAAVTLVRSLLHVFLPDGGAHSIASFITFTGNPDPDALIHLMFALWGLSQLIVAILYVVVILRYRSLIPLMLLLMVFEYGMRIVIMQWLKPLSDAYIAHTPPGASGNVIMFVFASVLLVLSVVLERRTT